jgi:aryl-alcohol dehydrogenase-like predicted oxidoreductase
MRFKLLGPSGLRVAEVALGTMTFGDTIPWGAPRDECRRIFDAYVAAGGNFIDTAPNYTGGMSEQLVGEFVAGQRDRFVVATKYTMHPHTGDPNVAGNHRKNLVHALDGSLRRLGTDYVDLYWVHAWDGLTPVEEMMRALDDQVRAGKILYAGISNAPAWVVAQANTLAALRGWTPFIGIQISYSLIERTAERDLLPMARAFGLGVTAWAPLGSGLLTGKYNQQPQAEQRRLDTSTAVTVDERNLAIASAVGEVAAELDLSAAQVALAWVRQRGALPLLGARTPAQFAANLASLDLTLDAGQLSRLDAASAIDLGYPHDFLARDNIRASVSGGMGHLLDR